MLKKRSFSFSDLATRDFDTEQEFRNFEERCPKSEKREKESTGDLVADIFEQRRKENMEKNKHS